MTARMKGTTREFQITKSPTLRLRKLKNVFDDRVLTLPLESRKMLSVLLMETFRKRFQMKITAAALEAAWITGFNEKTIRIYRKDFFENHGVFK